MAVKISTDFDQTIKELNKMQTNAQKVIDRTLNDFRSRGPGWVAQEIVKEYNIKKSEIGKGSHDKIETSASSETIEIKYEGRVLTPVHFGMTPKAPKQTYKANKKYTTPEFEHKETKKVRTFKTPKHYNIALTIKKNGKKVLGGKYDTPPFLAKSNGESGKYIPFQRVGKDRLPIVAIKTASLPQMVDNDEVQERIYKAIDDKLGRRLDHYMKRYLGK